MTRTSAAGAFLLGAILISSVSAAAKVSGELRKWHKVTITFDGPSGLSEKSNPNPFEDYRLDVTFTQGPKKYVVPGYYAADGNAAESSADSGNKWMVHFAPSATGKWTWSASFKKGEKVAIRGGGSSDNSINGMSGSINIGATNKSGRDNRGKGMLQVVKGKHHLRWAETGKYFMKMGADSPENFLAYEGFDNTPNEGGRRKSWGPHVKDFKGGNTWKNGKGKGIMGAIAYLAGKGMNVQSMLTMNIKGDDKNVYPYVSASDFTRFDVSKLAQWERVMEYMDEMGMYIHVKMQERENDRMFNRDERTLYHRELVSRFSHHLALNWNIGEENTNTLSDQISFGNEMNDLDPYDHNIVIHSHPGDIKKMYSALLNYAGSGRRFPYTGLSLQSGSPSGVYRQIREYKQMGLNNGVALVIASDEQGPWTAGIMPDASTNHASNRKDVIWGSIMAGGAGVEAYFGWQYPQSDMTCEDFRSRSKWWDMCSYALEFVEKYVPFYDMKPDDNFAGNNWALSSSTHHLVYMDNGGSANVKVGGKYGVAWFEPSKPVALKAVGCVDGSGSIKAPSGGEWVAILWKGCSSAPPKLGGSSGGGGGRPEPVPSSNPPPPPPPTDEPAPPPPPPTGGGGGGKCFGEVDGRIIIPAEEAVKITAGWDLQKKIKGYSGSGYLKWVDKDSFSYQGKGILEYNVYAKTGGDYKVNLYTAREAADQCRSDMCNDCFVRSGSDNIKLFTGFGQTNDKWVWSALFDKGHKKFPPIIKLPAGASKFIISGRSKDFCIDRIELTKTGASLSTSGMPTMVNCGGGGGRPEPAPKTPEPAPKTPSPPAPETPAPKTPAPRPQPTPGGGGGGGGGSGGGGSGGGGSGGAVPKVSALPPSSGEPEGTCAHEIVAQRYGQLPSCQKHVLPKIDGKIEHHVSYSWGTVRDKVIAPADYWIAELQGGFYRTPMEANKSSLPNRRTWDKKQKEIRRLFYDPMTIPAKYNCCNREMYIVTKVKYCSKNTNNCKWSNTSVKSFTLECQSRCTKKFTLDSGCPVC